MILLHMVIQRRAHPSTPRSGAPIIGSNERQSKAYKKRPIKRGTEFPFKRSTIAKTL